MTDRYSLRAPYPHRNWFVDKQLTSHMVHSGIEWPECAW